MAAEPSAVEQAVSRTLRESLERIHRSSEELLQQINDLVSACASSRPTNVLPPMIRAQTCAASLSAVLEVLSRFVTAALQPALHMPLEQETLRAVSAAAAEQPTVVEQPEPAPAHLTEEAASPADALPPAVEPAFSGEPVPVVVHEATPEVEPLPADEAQLEIAPPEANAVFRLDSLPPEEQELHRRAYRVAKVSMQDIKMLRPEDVRLGRENKDLCVRLRDDIEKAHKEYDRRFQPIHLHPVDYFYDWMVEILAGGNPEALGEYPYPSPVLRR
jgi:hypothetical protein